MCACFEPCGMHVEFFESRAAAVAAAVAARARRSFNEVARLAGVVDQLDVIELTECVSRDFVLIPRAVITRRGGVFLITRRTRIFNRAPSKEQAVVGT